MKKPTLQDRAEYAVARALQAAISALSDASADRAGAQFGSWVRSPLGIRKRVVAENLRSAFPAASDEWIEATSKRAFEHLGREAAAILRLSRLPPERVVERTDLIGEDELRAELGNGRGAILFTGHFGNWEVGAAAIAARGIPMHAVTKRLRNPLVDQRLGETRHRLGIQTISHGKAPRQVPRALRQGHVVGIVGDQDARASGLWIPFFGRDASTHRGPALFARRLGSPLFATFVTRLPGTPPRYRVHLDQVSVPETGDLEADLQAATEVLHERLEAAIREHPEQYFWLHKRWKTPPPPEPSNPRNGTTGAETRSNLSHRRSEGA